MIDQEILVTGASGFLGSHLLDNLRKEGYTAWGLSSASSVNVSNIPFKLGEKLSLPLKARNAKILIHCAYDFSDRLPPHQNINFWGSQQLFQDALEIGIKKIIFISSMSAHPHAQSNYGRCKYLIEQVLNEQSTVSINIIVRPGFIIGSGGVCGKLIRQIKLLPILPIFYGEKSIQIVDLERLLSAISAAVRLQGNAELNLGSRDVIETRFFYFQISRLLNLKFRGLRLPGAVGLSILKLIEKFGILLPLSSDNLLGLKYSKVWNTSPSWSYLNLEIPTVKDCLNILNDDPGVR